MTTATADPRSSGEAQDLILARQPILDPSGVVVAYELLYRSASFRASAGLGDASAASASVLLDGWLGIGAARLTDGLTAYVNVGPDLLLGRQLLALASDGLVIELTEDVPVNPEVRAAVGELRDHGFKIALDDVVGDDPRLALLDLVDIVKLDVRASSRAERVAVAAAVQQRGLTLLAEKVETHEEHREAVALGATLVQGFYFATPEPVTAHRRRGLEPSQVELLDAVGRAEVDVEHVERLIRQDLDLADRFLRYVNAAAFGWRRQITSLRHALVLLGNERVRSWVALLVMGAVTSSKPRQLMVIASMRARFCESLGRMAQIDDAFALFMAGMFSVIDAALDLPLERAIEGVPLPDAAREALLGRPSPVGTVLQAVIACERADWDRLGGALAALGISEDAIAEPYLDAITWAGELTRSTVADQY